MSAEMRDAPSVQFLKNLYICAYEIPNRVCDGCDLDIAWQRNTIWKTHIHIKHLLVYTIWIFGELNEPNNNSNDDNDTSRKKAVE